MHNNPTQLVLTCGIVVIVLASVVAGVSSCTDSAPVDELRRELRLGEKLDADLRLVGRKMENKERVIKALVAEQMSLLEAAACFQQIEREGPNSNPCRRADWNVTSDEEYYCRQVLRFLWSRSPKCAERLEPELQDLLRLQGGLPFPAEHETARRLERLNRQP